MKNCKPQDFKPQDLEQALLQLSMLRYWTPDLRAPVMHLLTQICPHRQALEWLIAQLVNHVGYWPGPAETRGLLCSRFDAADGIDAYCSLPGYGRSDGLDFEGKLLE